MRRRQPCPCWCPAWIVSCFRLVVSHLRICLGAKPGGESGLQYWTAAGLMQALMHSSYLSLHRQTGSQKGLPILRNTQHPSPRITTRVGAGLASSGDGAGPEAYQTPAALQGGDLGILKGPLEGCCNKMAVHYYLFRGSCCSCQRH